MFIFGIPFLSKKNQVVGFCPPKLKLNKVDIGPGEGDGFPIKILLSDCKTNQQRMTAPKPALPRPKSRDDKGNFGKSV